MAQRERKFTRAQLRAIFAKYREQGLRPGGARLKTRFLARQQAAQSLRKLHNAQKPKESNIILPAVKRAMSAAGRAGKFTAKNARQVGNALREIAGTLAAARDVRRLAFLGGAAAAGLGGYYYASNGDDGESSMFYRGRDYVNDAPRNISKRTQKIVKKLEQSLERDRQRRRYNGNSSTYPKRFY